MGFSGKKALAGAGAGAAAGSAFGPWGTAIGGGVGVLMGLFGDDEAPQAAPAYSGFDPKAFQNYSQTPADLERAAQRLGYVGAGPSQSYITDARNLQMGSRGDMSQGMRMLQDYATGEKSAARLAAADAIDRSNAMLASRAASVPGGYDPAVARASLMQQSAAGQNVAGRTAVAAAQEQLGAQQAYIKAAQAMRGQDLGLMGQERGMWGQLSARQLAEQQAKQQAMSLWMQNQALAAQQQMGLERMKMQAYESGAGRGQQQGNINYGYGQQQDMGTMNALGQALPLVGQNLSDWYEKRQQQQKWDSANKAMGQYFPGWSD